MSEPTSPEPAAPPLDPAASRRAIDLVAAYRVAQWNVVQARVVSVSDEQFREAKERQVAAHGALRRPLLSAAGRAQIGESCPTSVARAHGSPRTARI